MAAEAWVQERGLVDLSFELMMRWSGWASAEGLKGLLFLYELVRGAWSLIWIGVAGLCEP